MMQVNSNLRINNPCPTLLARMQKDGENYFCQGCHKTIIDFREKSFEEIKCMANKDTCGIFTFDQLQGQQKMKVSRQILFYGLTILSFFGFTVRPLKAQSNPGNAERDTVSVDLKIPGTESEVLDKTRVGKAAASKEKTNGWRRKKKGIKHYRRIGCPDF